MRRAVRAQLEDCGGGFVLLDPRIQRRRVVDRADADRLGRDENLSLTGCRRRPDSGHLHRPSAAEHDDEDGKEWAADGLGVTDRRDHGRQCAVGTRPAAGRQEPVRRVPGDQGRRAHHVAVGTADYREALETVEAKGRRVLQGGTYNGVTFAYISTDEDLKVITEIFDWPPGLVQEPDARYP